MSPVQVFMTLPHDRSPTAGPALTVSALIPDLHHYLRNRRRSFRCEPQDIVPGGQVGWLQDIVPLGKAR